MSPSSPKEQAAALAKRIREARAAGDPVAVAVALYLKVLVDEEKEVLVQADGSDMLRTQGAVRRLQRVHKDLTVDPPTITKGT